MDIEGMNNARLGVVYLWQGVKCKSPIAEAVTGGIMTSVSGILGTQDINVAEFSLGADVSAMALESRSGDAQGTFAKVKAWAEDLLKKIWAKLKEVFGDIAEVASMLKGIALFVTQQVFANAAPIIGGVAGLVQGLWSTTVGIVEKVGNWVASKDVKIAFGHPTTLIEGIERGITRALLEGIYTTIKSAVSVGLNAASFGGAAIVDCVTGIVEAAVKIIWRVAEQRIINKFITDAKLMWGGRKEASALHKNNQKFDEWLKPATQKVPLLAAVTLGTGIAGDKMRFLQMYTGQGTVISQSSFDAGCAYIDQIKRSGSRVMERSGIEFNSDDKVIEGMLKLAKSHDEVRAASSKSRRLFRFMDKFLRA